MDAEGGGDEDGEWGVTLVENSANRGCTDIVFLALFVVAFIALITVLTTVAFRKGDITKFVAGKDHDGFTCGVDPLVAQFPYTCASLSMRLGEQVCNRPSLLFFMNFSHFGFVSNVCLIWLVFGCNGTDLVIY